MHSRRFITTLAAGLATLAGSTLALAQTLPNAVASGETTSTSSLLWARTNFTGNLTFEYSTDPGFGSILGSSTTFVTDVTQPVKAPVAGLSPNTEYYFRAVDSTGAASAGKFRTAAASGYNGFRFGASGDWRGELAPYPAVKNVVGRDLDLWISLGDTIYADIESPALPGVGQAETLVEFRAKHNEVYSTRFGLNTLGDIRSNMSIIATIDDHEVTNDFAGGAHPSSDPRFSGQPGNFINETTLFNNGIQAFQEYNPITPQNYGATADPRTAGKTKLYRAQSFGQDAAILSLDTRSFRDQGLPAANPLDPVQVGGYLAASFTPGRTMLGRAQIDDLKADLLSAQANGTTWKFINVPEPIQNLGVLNASDRFEGYAAERTEILKFIDDNNIENVVFVAADIHGTLVNNLTYQNGPGQPQIPTGAFEITTGSVAFDAPFGPTVAGIAAGLGIPGALPLPTYQSLSLAQKEGYIQNLINAQITPLGYDPLGLQGSEIPATLLQGGYTATNTFGWTEFDINPLTQALTVTTWGILPYTEAELLANPNLITEREPFIVSQFVVQAVPTPGVAGLFALVGVSALRRRR